ncbi:MAG TPA: patatin-like phospholipase family protein [Hyphomicrobiaceae bacterium]|nr:patatin-like phospholipase family protein [Hyphomicrobiaceae bacterium]
MAAAETAQVRTGDAAFAPGQIVLVFQGGGALGAYQAGVYQALHEAGIEPDWIIGTSIGAINASLIAGNEAHNRLPRLEEFWRRMADKSFWHDWSLWPQMSQALSYWKTLSSGIPGFFEPNPPAFLGPHVPLGPDRAGYYSTAPLEQTLRELVDFSLINRCRPRLTVGAAHVRSSQMRYFDGRDMPIGVKHIMASGALPPAFPPVRIDGELYWDGGILSNTPTEVVFDDNPRRNSLVFAVHMWNPLGPEPETMWDVQHRQKDIQYSSRVATQIARQRQIHRLRHVIKELAAYIPETARGSEAVRELLSYGCLTRIHVVRLLAPRLDNEDHTKDVDFSPSGIRKRWQAGYASTRRAIERAPWQAEVDPLEGAILHESTDGSGSGQSPKTPIAPEVLDNAELAHRMRPAAE